MLPYLQVLTKLGPIIVQCYTHLAICLVVVWLEPERFRLYKGSQWKYQLSDMSLGLLVYIALRRLEGHFNMLRFVKENVIPIIAIPAYPLLLLWYLSSYDLLAHWLTSVRLLSQLLLLALVLYGCRIVVEKAIDATREVRDIFLLELNRNDSTDWNRRQYNVGTVKKYEGKTENQSLTSKQMAQSSSSPIPPNADKSQISPNMESPEHIMFHRQSGGLISNSRKNIPHYGSYYSNQASQLGKPVRVAKLRASTKSNPSSRSTSGSQSPDQPQNKPRSSLFNLCVIDRRLKPFDWGVSTDRCLDHINSIKKLRKRTIKMAGKLNSSPI